MSSESYMQVRCPFYQSDDGAKKIVCKGITTGSDLSFTFQKKKDYEIQRKVFCCDYYRNCEVYTMLARRRTES